MSCVIQIGPSMVCRLIVTMFLLTHPLEKASHAQVFPDVIYRGREREKKTRNDKMRFLFRFFPPARFFRGKDDPRKNVMPSYCQ